MHYYLVKKIRKFVLKTRITDYLDNLLIGRKKFAIVSNNCWGLKLYKITGREYNTPFVGLFISPTDYLELLKNIEKYLRIEMNTEHFISTEKYPVASIEGVNIHFLHYTSISSAIGKWNRRRLRLLDFIKDNGIDSVVFKYCDQDTENQSNLNTFNQLSYKNKIALSKTDKRLVKKNGEFLDGLELFELRILYYRKYLSLFR